MNNDRPRQFIRRVEKTFHGKKRSFVFQSEEHSAFLSDGNIISRQRTEAPVLKGVVPHEPNDVAGECQSCLNFATEQMLIICDCCWEVVCLPCAGEREGMRVCPSCAQYLVRRRRTLILRKLFIDPFVEQVR
mgnify:CR=1 FL=1